MYFLLSKKKKKKKSPGCCCRRLGMILHLVVLSWLNKDRTKRAAAAAAAWDRRGGLLCSFFPFSPPFWFFFLFFFIRRERERGISIRGLCCYAALLEADEFFFSFLSVSIPVLYVHVKNLGFSSPDRWSCVTFKWLGESTLCRTTDETTLSFLLDSDGRLFQSVLMCCWCRVEICNERKETPAGSLSLSSLIYFWFGSQRVNLCCNCCDAI